MIAMRIDDINKQTDLNNGSYHRLASQNLSEKSTVPSVDFTFDVSEEGQRTEDQGATVSISERARELFEAQSEHKAVFVAKQEMSRQSDGRVNFQVDLEKDHGLEIEEAYASRVTAKIQGTGVFQQVYGSPNNLQHVNIVG